ncbi:maestro heat-like repeat family member 5 [Mirounga leonina]|uniref:maestro heat-like repeat family member 5 n=1 Tax=Mirounga leonina TaxID=9715 RepID=UPI00156BF841|nr:maestro heat-like repeat family member 5 [Mirounga leonina]
MAAHSDDSHGPQGTSNGLWPTEEEELGVAHPDREILEEPLSDRLLWEEALLGKIRTMSVLQRNVLLDAIHHCIKEHSQLIWKEVASTGIQELLAPLNLELKQPLEKTFLFHIYGLILRESANEELVRRHLADLLELSHQSANQREGIAAAIGIVSSSHLPAVWAALEHLGRTRFLRTAFMSPDCQQPDPDRPWRWVGCTSLLCYGQMALHAREQILPWVDNIISRMVYYFSCSCYDNILKTSFLSATIILMKALKQENSTRSYKFSQIPELIQCLLCILQKEPNFLATLFRQKIIMVIVGLSNLRPSLKPMVKSRILQTCLQSLFMLPPMEKLKSCLPPLDPAPDVMVLYKKSMQALDLLLQNFISENKSMDEMCFLLQHMEPWLQSDKSHECKRVVQTIFLLLKYVVDYVTLTEEATPSLLGHQIGLLVLLWRDKDPVTRGHSHQCIYLLLQLLIQQKGSMEQFMYLNKMKNFEAKARRESEMKFYNMVKALNRSLTVAQHTQLILTLLEGLGSRSRLQCDLASQLLLVIFEDHGIKVEQVAEILQGLFQELPSVVFKSILQTMMRMVTLLGTQHTEETVEVILSLCHPSDRQVLPLWKALASNTRLARKVLTLLYVKLKLRPPRERIRLSQQAELISLLALGTIYELLYTREYKATVRWAFAGILVGLLTQLHYLFELDAVEGISDYQEDILEMKPLSPCRTCLEALKGLFWTTNYWEVFAYLKLLRGWELFEHLETYTEGVTLLARAMAHYDCEVKAVLGQAVISLKSSEERDNIVAILIITEFALAADCANPNQFLNSQELTQYISRRTMDNFLSLGLNNPNQLVRAISLKGLSSILMHPKKVVLLRNRLAGLLDGFVKPEPKDLLGLMEILGNILLHLGAQGVGAASLEMAQHLLPLFEDEQAPVRGRAISLFGDVICSRGKKHQPVLKSYAFQALVPLLFHLEDSCPNVVTNTKLTFLRCAILLKWEFRKELFGKLAWGHGLGAENDIFIYMVESNFGRYHQFLMQALIYLASPHKNLKHTAMKFIGGILQEYFTDLCFSLKKGDLKILRKYMEVLKQDPDSVSRRFYNSFLEDISELSLFVRH